MTARMGWILLSSLLVVPVACAAASGTAPALESSASTADAPSTPSLRAEPGESPTTGSTSSPSIAAQGPSALDYLKLLEDKNKDVHTMIGTFVQTTNSDMFLEKNTYMGRFYYLRPNQFRVDYTEREGKREDSTLLMLADELWDYVPSIKQATRISLRSQSGKQREINQFLLGFGVQAQKALEYFDVSLGTTDSTGRTFTLVFKAKNPDETMQFTKATITFDRQNLRPKTIVLEQSYGDRTEIALGDVKFNESVKESLFQPDWPKGTEIIEQ